MDKQCDSRHLEVDKKIVRSGKVNKGISAGTGLFGGWLAVITSKLLGM
jgi:hypothetical protein